MPPAIKPILPEPEYSDNRKKATPSNSKLTMKLIVRIYFFLVVNLKMLQSNDGLKKRLSNWFYGLVFIQHLFS